MTANVLRLSIAASVALGSLLAVSPEAWAQG